ncbi:MAG TPA: hypothetical protein VIL48_01165 [Acidimicrobiales bacterium]
MATSIAPSPPDTPAAAAGELPADRFALGVGAAVVAGLALRIAIGVFDGAPSRREAALLQPGLSLLDGDGFARGGVPETQVPPFVPILLGLADRVLPDPHVGAVALTVLAGAAAIVPLALLGRRLAGPAAGVVTAWVAALAPGLATLPATQTTVAEAVLVLLVAAAVWLVVSAGSGRGAAGDTAGVDGRRPLLRVAGAGLLAGLAALTRPEGLAVAAPLGAAVLVLAARPPADPGRGRWGPGLALVGAFVLPLALCLAPYARFLHDHTGGWRATAESRDASVEAWHAAARGDRSARDRALFELDESGLGLTPAAARHTPRSELAADDPVGYAGVLAANGAALVRNVGGWWLLPLPAWALAAVGAWRRRRSGPVRLVVAVGSLPVAVALAVLVHPAPLVVTVVAAAVLAGAAWPTLAGRWRVPVLVGTLAALALASLAGFVGDRGFGHPDDETDQRRAGEWIADHTAPSDRVMARSAVVELYAGRPAVAMPDADVDGILRFARHHGVRYLVVDESHARDVRPRLLPLLAGDGEWTAGDTGAWGLRLVHEARAEGRVTRVFALDPRPDADAAEPPPTLAALGAGGEA